MILASFPLQTWIWVSFDTGFEESAAEVNVVSMFLKLEWSVNWAKFISMNWSWLLN